MTRPARARPMAHRIGGRTSDLFLSAQREVGSGIIMGIEIWGRQLTTRGAEIWGPKRGSFWLLKLSQNRGYPQWYISTPAWRSDPPFHMQFTGSPTKTDITLALIGLHATRRGYNPNWVQNCQNSKIGRLGRPSRVGNVGDIDAPSLDSQPLISPMVPCPGLWLAVTLAACCSSKG